MPIIKPTEVCISHLFITRLFCRMIKNPAFYDFNGISVREF